MPIRPPQRAVTLTLGLTLSLTGFAATAQELEQTSTAAAFDQQLQNFHNGRFDALDASAEQRELERLHAWLPAGDAARELEYRTANCMHMVRHDPTAALKYAEQALVPAQEAGATEVQVRLLLCAGLGRGMSPTPTDAFPAFDQAVTLAKENNLSGILADALVQRGSLYSLLGEQARALIDFLAAQDHYRAAGREDVAEINLINIATVYRRMGEYAKAREYLQQGRTNAQRDGRWPELFMALVQLGYLDNDTDQPQSAEQHFSQALETAIQRTGIRQDQGNARVGLATALINQKRYRQGLTILEQARADFASLNDGSNEGEILLLQGNARAGLGDHANALRYYEQALPILQRSDNTRYLARLYRARTDSYEALGNYAAALADFRQYIQLRETLVERMRNEQTIALRLQFDSNRRDMENQRLLAETQLREQQLQAMMRMRQWQWVAIALAGLLLLVLSTLAVRQVIRLRQMRTLAMSDPLTGIANRRSLERQGNTAVADAQAHGTHLCLLSLDIDHFKRINDNHGHAAGDTVLRQVAQACQNALRQFDLLGRIGGEEFIVLLPGAELEQAIDVAERLRRCVESLRFPDELTELRVTISLGVTKLHQTDRDLSALAIRADRALYRAKAGGRNRLEVEA